MAALKMTYKKNMVGTFCYLFRNQERERETQGVCGGQSSAVGIKSRRDRKDQKNKVSNLPKYTER